MEANHPRYLRQYLTEVWEDTRHYKLDVLDRKILYLLSVNARLSYSTIARLVHTSREVVAYRVKKMREDKLILGFLTYIEERKVGFLAHLVLIKLKPIMQEKEFIQGLLKVKQLSSLKYTSGAFDLSLRITTRTLDEFEHVLEEIIGTYGHMIENHIILNRLRGGYLGHEYLVEKNVRDELKKHLRTERKGTAFQRELAMREKISVKVDEKDRVLLKELQFDARLSVQELAKRARLSQQGTVARVRKLIRGSVIGSFYPEIAIPRLGFLYYDLLLYMKNIDEHKFLAYLRESPYVYWYLKHIGMYNYKLTIFAKDAAHFHQIMTELRSVFGENMVSFNPVIMFNQYLYEAKV